MSELGDYGLFFLRDPSRWVDSGWGTGAEAGDFGGMSCCSVLYWRRTDVSCDAGMFEMIIVEVAGDGGVLDNGIPILAVPLSRGLSSRAVLHSKCRLT